MLAARQFQSQGLQWAFEGLRIRQEVGGVMEEMLDVVEVSRLTMIGGRGIASLVRHGGTPVLLRSLWIWHDETDVLLSCLYIYMSALEAS